MRTLAPSRLTESGISRSRSTAPARLIKFWTSLEKLLGHARLAPPTMIVEFWPPGCSITTACLVTTSFTFVACFKFTFEDAASASINTSPCPSCPTCQCQARPHSIRLWTIGRRSNNNASNQRSNLADEVGGVPKTPGARRFIGTLACFVQRCFRLSLGAAPLLRRCRHSPSRSPPTEDPFCWSSSRQSMQAKTTRNRFSDSHSHVLAARKFKFQDSRPRHLRRNRKDGC